MSFIVAGCVLLVAVLVGVLLDVTERQQKAQGLPNFESFRPKCAARVRPAFGVVSPRPGREDRRGRATRRDHPAQ